MATFQLIVVLVCVYLTMHHAAGRDSAADYQSDGRDQEEVSLPQLHGDSDYKRLALEMRKLRAELRVVRQNCEAIVGDVARVSDLSLKETNERLAIVKTLAETAALGLKQSTSLWDSNIQALRAEFREESSSTSRKLSELQNNLRSKLVCVENECDLKTQSLNTTVQTRAAENDINIKKVANETAVIRSLELGIGSINATLNRMLGLEGPNRWPETDPSVNATFRRIGPLKLVVSSAKLPAPRAHSSAVYDGIDPIYIIGGNDGSTIHDKVLKYSLLSGTVEITTTFLKRHSGSAIMDGEFITYFGGFSGEYESGIYRISPTKWGYSHVGSLPVKIYGMGVAWDPLNRTAYLFGGVTPGPSSDQILSYSAATHQTTQVGRLPEKRKYVTASWDSKRKVAHLFSGNDTWQFIPPNIVTSHKALPYTLADPCSVYASANDHVYVFGGGGKLIKYNPTNHMSTLMDVQMWPHYLHGAACVYVPKQHRMYIFGGWGRQRDGDSNKWRDEIAFIDLDWP